MSQDTAVVSVVGPIASGSLAAIGQSPSLAMGMTYVAMADSIGLAMQNAVANQQRSQVLANAAVVQVLSLIISK